MATDVEDGTDPRGNDVERLHGIRRDVERAMNVGDTSYFDDHATEDVVVMPALQRPEVGRNAAKAGMEEFFAEFDVGGIDYDSEEVVVGEEFAFDRGSVTERYKPKGAAEMDEHLLDYLFLYRRTSAGAWKQFRVVWKMAEPHG